MRAAGEHFQLAETRSPSNGPLTADRSRQPSRRRVGWGGRIRTFEYGIQSPAPYRLATPQETRRRLRPLELAEAEPRPLPADDPGARYATRRYLGKPTGRTAHSRSCEHLSVYDCHFWRQVELFLRDSARASAAADHSGQLHRAATQPPFRSVRTDTEGAADRSAHGPGHHGLPAWPVESGRSRARGLAVAKQSEHSRPAARHQREERPIVAQLSPDAADLRMSRDDCRLEVVHDRMSGPLARKRRLLRSRTQSRACDGLRDTSGTHPRWTRRTAAGPGRSTTA